MTALQRGRTAVFAVLATVLALLAHLAGGGAAPSAGALGLTLLLTGTAGAWLASRSPSVTRAVAGLGAVQAATHLLFAAGAPMAHGSDSAMSAAHAAAVLVTGWLLTRGERAVEALLTRVVVALPGPLPALPVPAVPRPVPWPVVRRPGDVARAHLQRRGPPGSTAAVL